MRRHAALVVSLVALATTATQLPDTFRTVADAARKGTPDAAEAELAPAAAIGVPREVLLGARRAIPESARYAIVLGDSLPLTESQRVGVPQLLRYWLLPRRWTGAVDDADYVVAYGQAGETLGVEVAEETELIPGVVVVKVRR